MGGSLGNDVLKIAPMEKWWKSSEIFPENSYSSYLSGRNWIMNEEFGLTMLRFQQAGLVANYVGFTYWEWEEGFEIIVFEQLALMFMVWGIGCFLSMIVFGYQKMKQTYLKNNNQRRKLIILMFMIWEIVCCVSMIVFV